MTVLLLIFAVAVILLSGFVVLRALDPGGYATPGGAAFVALAFIAGCGAVSLQGFLYSLAGVPIGRLMVTAPWVAAAVIVLLIGRGSASAVRSGCLDRLYSSCRTFMGTGGLGSGVGGSPERWGRYLLWAVIASQVVYVFLYAPFLPINGWDAWSIWFLKARAFYIDGGVSPEFLTDPSYGYSHPDYPLLVPLSAAWVYTASGSAFEAAAKMLWPLQFVALLTVFNWGLRRVTGRPGTALLFTTLLSVTPVLVLHAAGVPAVIGGELSGDYVGYADLILAIFVLASGVFLCLYMGEGEGRAGGAFIALAALMAASGAWTKNEGLAFALIAALLLALGIVLRARAGAGLPPLARLASAAVVLALFILPWLAYRHHLGLGSDVAGGFGLDRLASNLSRIGDIIPALAERLFARPTLFGLAWYAYPVSFLVARARAFTRPLVFLNLLLVGQLAVYVLVYVMTPADLAWHIDKSMNRLVMHLTPLALFIAALNATAFLGGRGLRL